MLWPLQLWDSRITESVHTRLTSRCPKQIAPPDLAIARQGEVLEWGGVAQG